MDLGDRGGGNEMDFRQLKYFIAVAEEENIGRAARRLHISQPPLTRQIKQIEDELGVNLFIRTPKGMELTAVGRLFLEEARNIALLFEQATERTMEAAQGRLGRLDVAIFGSGIIDAIPKIMLAFNETYPGVKVHLHQMGKAEQIEALRQRRINVGFNRMLTPQPDLTSELIFTEPLLLAVNEKHPLSRLDSIPFSALKDHPLILFPREGRPNFVDKVISICAEVGFFPKITQEVGDAVTGVALVASGFGICIVPKSLTALALPGVVFRPISERPAHWAVDLSCIYRRDDETPILAAFLGTMRAFRASLSKQA